MTNSQFIAHPYEDVLFRSDALFEDKADEGKDGMIQAAFNAWLMGAGQKDSFDKYVKRLGLVKDEPITNKKQAIKEALAKAEKILKMDRGE